MRNPDERSREQELTRRALLRQGGRLGAATAALGSGALWRGAGAVIARLHRAGVDHADLNAHNILLDTRGAFSVIDFDRGRLRAQGAWTSRNLQRLRRSLRKISAELPPDRYSDRTWDWFMAGYRTVAGPAGQPDTLQLQYTQLVQLDFNGLRWPHVTVATLHKQ